jgi:hypothetical protein
MNGYRETQRMSRASARSARVLTGTLRAGLLSRASNRKYLRTMIDKIKFIKASAILSAFKDSLPQGDIELNHVDDYHAVLDDLQGQFGIDLSEFRIPKSALKERAIPQSFSMDAWGNTYGEPYRFEPYCDRDVFKRQLNALIIFTHALPIERSTEPRLA